jgi:Transposase IS4
MVPNFLPYDNGNEEEKKDENVPIDAVVDPDDALPVVTNHGQHWYDAGEVTLDHGVCHRRTRLLWPGNPNDPHGPQPLRPLLEYFKLMYPMILNQTMLEHTNAMLASVRNAPTTVRELFKYFGLRLNMTLERTCANIPDFWMTDDIEGSTFIPPNYGKYGMTRHRFQTLSRCLRFATFDEGIVNEVR